MEAASGNLRHGWVWIFSLLIFFFNTMSVLPEGLTLVIIFIPLWIYFLYQMGELKVLPALFVPLLIYFPIHYSKGVQLDYYLASLVALCFLLIFITTFYFLINKYTINFELIFRDIVILNFILTIFSLALLYIPEWKEMVWYMVPISKNIDPIPRLKLFTSEASHYSFLLAPLAIYFFCKAMFARTSRAWIILAMIIIPLLLSFSLGVLLGLFISGLLILVIYFRRIFFTRKRWMVLVIFAGISILTLFITYKWFPDNALFQRISNIFKGDDTSARGRTYEAFIVADKVVQKKSSLWGVGPGQLKLFGRDIIIQFYFYSKIPQTIRIPNAMAETIAYFGYIGLAIRLLLEILLFFLTKVYRNPYRLWLFLFVFIYQFTGSYITNAAEYIIWVLAFSNVFPVFVNDSIRLKNEDIIPGKSHAL